MAHELLIEGGKAAMFYVNEVPWHGLGTALKEPPAAAEAIDAAGLNWEVTRVPLYVSGLGRLIQVPSKFALIRKDQLDRDDCPVFGLVGGDYELLQNRDAFAFFDPLIQEGLAEYHTAGALGRGERVWVLAKLKLPLKIGPDKIDPYVLLSNTHDGTGSVTVKLTPVRVVCQNTLSVALNSRKRSWRIRHTQSLSSRMDDVRGAVDELLQPYKELEAVFEAMRGTPLKESELDGYLSDVFPEPAREVGEHALELVRRRRISARYLARRGRGNDVEGIRDTLWAGYNGVADYADHRKTNRLASDYNDARLKYVWYGGGAALKQRALAFAFKRLSSAPRIEHLDLSLPS